MTYTVNGTTNKVDWKAVGSPTQIVIPQGHEVPLHFIGVQGTKENPVTISGGSVTVPVNLSYCIKFDNCRHFKFADCRVTGGHIGITCEKRSTDFELKYLHVIGSGAIGILAKTDEAKRTDTNPFVMTGKIHHCTVEDTGTEGIYVGSSKWGEGTAHECENVLIYSNIVKNTGWDGIQLGSCVKGARIYYNEVYNAGLKDEANQRNGIQVGEGTGGLCYENIVQGATGNGIQLLGPGNNMVYRNELSGCQENGIFANTKSPNGSGFKIFANTIDSPRVDGIRLYAKNVDHLVVNNIIINPQGTYIYILKGVTGHFEPNFLIRE